MAKTKTSLTLSKKNTTARENNKHARRNFFKRVLDIMAKTKPSKKTPPQSIGRLLWLLLRNTYITYLKLLIKLEGKDSINLEIESMIDGFQHPARKWFSKKWNFFIGDFSLKRIYRNSEGHIIPLLGGVLALAVFHSINASLSTRATGSNIIYAIFIFMSFLLVVWVIIYQLKKANLRSDVAAELAKIFIRHFSPYEYSDGDENASEKNLYIRVWFGENKRLKKMMNEYITHNKLNFIFSNDEIQYKIYEKMKEGIVSSVVSKLQTIPKEFADKSINLGLDYAISLNEKYNANILIMIKEGVPDSPKNSDLLEINIEEKDLSFVIFAKKGNKKFFDINTRHITHAEYKQNEVTLTIAQSNAKPKRITVSLSEWMANRNSLR